MSDNKTKIDERIIPEASETNENAAANTALDTPAEGTAPTPSKKRKILLAVVVVILVAAGGIAAWLTQKKPTPTANSPKQTVAEQKQTAWKPLPTKLVYSYKEGKKTKVREFDSKDNSKKDLFEFEEMYADDNGGNFTASLSPAVSLSNNGLALAYISKQGLFTRDVDATSSNQIIKATATLNKALKADQYKLAPSPTASDSSLFSLSGPTWSSDDKSLGFNIGHYEGSSANAINLQSKEYANPGETFRYGEQEGLGSSFTIVDKNKKLYDWGIFPGYRVMPDSFINSPQFSPDKSVIYAVLCPANTTDAGFSGEGITDNSGSWRDCGEPGDSELISINATDGTYKALTKGNYSTELVLGAKNTAYIPSKDKKNVFKINLLTGKSESIDIASKADLEKGAETLGLRVSDNTGLATVYYKVGNNYSVKVVEIETSRIFGSYKIEKVSAFKPLLLK